MEIKKHQLEPNPRIVNTLNAHDDILLSIKIGNGQIGGNKVSIGDKLLAKGDLKELTIIGKVVDLKDCEIEIVTNVLDVNKYTNECVITTNILNQENKVLYTKIDQGDAPEDGIACFKARYLIKIITMIILVFCVFYLDLSAQNSTDKINFKSLETPSSPGFILLDQAPSSIEKPTTPQGLGLSLLGLKKNSGALEFAPFWLTTHPDLTAEKMYKNKIPILYKFSVSVASIKTDSSNYSAGGIRTTLFHSYGKKINKLDSLKNAIIVELSNGDDIDTAKVEKLRKEYVNIVEKPLFNIDFAIALGGSSTTNSFNDMKFSRWATWLSLNWRPKGNDFYATVLTRYINNEKYEDYIVNADLFDIGTRLNYDISKLSLSLEYLHRMNFSANYFDDFRIAFIGSYKLSDNIYITSTFGKNFTDVNNIIAKAGVNFGFSNSKIKAF